MNKKDMLENIKFTDYQTESLGGQWLYTPYMDYYKRNKRDIKKYIKYDGRYFEMFEILPEYYNKAIIYKELEKENYILLSYETILQRFNFEGMSKKEILKNVNVEMEGWKMKAIYINKNKKNEQRLYIEIVNCNDIKITWYSKDPTDFYENKIYYSLDKNILKLEYKDNTENVYIFTPAEKKKIKKECIKLFLKEYKLLTNSDYKNKKIEFIKENLKKMEG